MLKFDSFGIIKAQYNVLYEIYTHEYIISRSLTIAIRQKKSAHASLS